MISWLFFCLSPSPSSSPSPSLSLSLSNSLFSLSLSQTLSLSISIFGSFRPLSFQPTIASPSTNRPSIRFAGQQMQGNHIIATKMIANVFNRRLFALKNKTQECWVGYHVYVFAMLARTMRKQCVGILLFYSLLRSASAHPAFRRWFAPSPPRAPSPLAPRSRFCACLAAPRSSSAGRSPAILFALTR